MNHCNTPLPTTIDGVTGEANIAKVWRKHFEDLLNCQRSTNSVDEVPNDNLDFNDLLVSKEEIVLAIKDLANNKSCGLDGIYAEHLKFASCHLVELLSLCFTSFFIHSVLPDSLISVILVPIIHTILFILFILYYVYRSISYSFTCYSYVCYSLFSLESCMCMHFDSCETSHGCFSRIISIIIMCFLFEQEKLLY